QSVAAVADPEQGALVHVRQAIAADSAKKGKRRLARFVLAGVIGLQREVPGDDLPGNRLVARPVGIELGEDDILPCLIGGETDQGEDGEQPQIGAFRRELHGVLMLEAHSAGGASQLIYDSRHPANRQEDLMYGKRPLWDKVNRGNTCAKPPSEPRCATGAITTASPGPGRTRILRSTRAGPRTRQWCAHRAGRRRR